MTNGHESGGFSVLHREGCRLCPPELTATSLGQDAHVFSAFLYAHRYVGRVRCCRICFPEVRGFRLN